MNELEIIIRDNFLPEKELQLLEDIVNKGTLTKLDDTGNHVMYYTKYSWSIINSNIRTSPHRFSFLSKLGEIYGVQPPTENLNAVQLFAKEFDADSFCAPHHEDPKIYGDWFFLLYLTDEIDGNLCFNGLTVTPKRNRLIVMKTGFEHWVEKCSGRRLNITGWSFASDEIVERWKSSSNK